MKKWLAILTVCVLVIACGIGVYASGLGDLITDQFSGNTNSDNISVVIGEDDIHKKEAIDNALATYTGISSGTLDSENSGSLLEEQSDSGNNKMSKYERLLIAMNATITDPADFNRQIVDYEYLREVHGLPQEQLDYIADLVIEGCNMNDVLDIVYFWLDTDDDISIVREIYNLRGDYEGKDDWINNAYDVITNAENGSLDVEDVESYFAKGITAEEIITADILCRKGVYTIQEILDKRCIGQSLAEIANEIENGELLGPVTLTGDVETVDYNSIGEPKFVTQAEEASVLTGISSAELLNSAAAGEDVQEVFLDKKTEKKAEIREKLQEQGIVKQEAEVE